MNVKIQKGRLTVVTGVSGSGKITLILKSLIPALENKICCKKLLGQIKDNQAEGIKQVKLIDATPIGINIC